MFSLIRLWHILQRCPENLPKKLLRLSPAGIFWAGSASLALDKICCWETARGATRMDIQWLNLLRPHMAMRKKLLKPKCFNLKTFELVPGHPKSSGPGAMDDTQRPQVHQHMFFPFPRPSFWNGFNMLRHLCHLCHLLVNAAAMSDLSTPPQRSRLAHSSRHSDVHYHHRNVQTRYCTWRICWRNGGKKSFTQQLPVWSHQRVWLIKGKQMEAHARLFLRNCRPSPQKAAMYRCCPHDLCWASLFSPSLHLHLSPSLALSLSLSLLTLKNIGRLTRKIKALSWTLMDRMSEYV